MVTPWLPADGPHAEQPRTQADGGSKEQEHIDWAHQAADDLARCLVSGIQAGHDGQLRQLAWGQAVALAIRAAEHDKRVPQHLQLVAIKRARRLLRATQCRPGVAPLVAHARDALEQHLAWLREREGWQLQRRRVGGARPRWVGARVRHH